MMVFLTDNVDQIAELITPLFEYLGIPLILLVPTTIFLIVLFKYIIPKILIRSNKASAVATAKVVSHLFGEGDGTIEGLGELAIVKLIRSLPGDVKNQTDRSIELDRELVELIVLMASAIMSERLIKPQNSDILNQIKKKGMAILERLDEEKQEDQIEEEREDQEIEKVEV
jgi:uncharacterized membrane protein